MLNNFINWLKSFKCDLIEHDPEGHLHETDLTISTARCRRCKCRLGIPTYKMYHIPPPHYRTQEQLKSWKLFLDEEYDKIRKSCG